MSLLDDARRLSELPPVETLVSDACVFCYAEAEKGLEYGEPAWTIDHAADCAWLALPRIVAALEAAERLVGTEYVMSGDLVRPEFFDSRNVNDVVAALRGEGVPA